MIQPDLSRVTKPTLVRSLADLIAWATGHRGTNTHINPYAVPEIKQALRVLERIQRDPATIDPKSTSWLDVNVEDLARLREEPKTNNTVAVNPFATSPV